MKVGTLVCKNQAQNGAFIAGHPEHPGPGNLEAPPDIGDLQFPQI